MDTHITLFRAPAFGWCGLAGSGGLLKKFYLPERDRAGLLARMRSEYPAARLQDGWCEELACELLAYFGGGRADFHCRLDFTGTTPFQQKVWKAARSIKYGQVRTYGWLAQKAGSPGAVRAVGSALGRNPFPIIIPCHRVIRSDGGLGGFSAAEGVPLKKKLLDLEAIELEG